MITKSNTMLLVICNDYHSSKRYKVNKCVMVLDFLTNHDFCALLQSKVSEAPLKSHSIKK